LKTRRPPEREGSLKERGRAIRECEILEWETSKPTGNYKHPTYGIRGRLGRSYRLYLVSACFSLASRGDSRDLQLSLSLCGGTLRTKEKKKSRPRGCNRLDAREQTPVRGVRALGGLLLRSQQMASSKEENNQDTTSRRPAPERLFETGKWIAKPR